MYKFLLASLTAALLPIPAFPADYPSPAPAVKSAIESALYRVRPDGKSFEAINPTQHLQMRFADNRTEITFQKYLLSFELQGEGSLLHRHVEGSRIELEYVRFNEWFVNDPAGLEQGFTVSRKPDSGALQVSFMTGGRLQPALEGNEVVFRDGSSTILRYGGLRSWDAEGRMLSSHALVTGRQITLEVNDAGAHYPVTIDPVVSQATLTDPTTDPFLKEYSDFGEAVALSADGNTAVVGNRFQTGKAYVFTRSGGTWTLMQQFDQSTDNADQFGYSVALSSDGNTAIIGSVELNFFAKAAQNGGAYVYTRTDTSSGTSWVLQQRLRSSDFGIANADGRFGNSFGAFVAISGDGNTALVSAYDSAYVFTRSGTIWTQQQKITNVGTSWDLNLSVALSGDGNAALIGGDGNVYAFTRSGTVWTQQQTFTSQDTSEDFGYNLTMTKDGSTALMASIGGVYAFTQSNGIWTQQQKIISLDPGNYQYALSMANDDSTALVGARYAGYLFTASGGVWSQQQVYNVGSDAVALSGDGQTALLGIYNGPYGDGVTVFTNSNISLESQPSGRSFTLSGAECATGTYSTPYVGHWSNPCTVNWTSPDLSAANTQYTFQTWSDGDTENPRTFSPQPLADPNLYPLTAEFQTEYQLTTVANPLVGGQLSPSTTTANWYPAGTNILVSESPNPGYVFTKFTGGLIGEVSPQLLTMNGPQTVTANFSPTPAAIQLNRISAKSGPSKARLWTINFMNAGPGTAYGAQLVGLMLTQTLGAPCAHAPIRTSPLFPVGLGDIPAGATAQTQVTLDFSACPSNARFAVTIDEVANGGSSVAVLQLLLQSQ